MINFIYIIIYRTVTSEMLSCQLCYELKNSTRKENTVFTCYERLLKTIYYLFFPLQLSVQKSNIWYSVEIA